MSAGNWSLAMIITPGPRLPLEPNLSIWALEAWDIGR